MSSRLKRQALYSTLVDIIVYLSPVMFGMWALGYNAAFIIISVLYLLFGIAYIKVQYNKHLTYYRNQAREQR